MGFYKCYFSLKWNNFTKKNDCKCRLSQMNKFYAIKLIAFDLTVCLHTLRMLHVAKIMPSHWVMMDTQCSPQYESFLWRQINDHMYLYQKINPRSNILIRWHYLRWKLNWNPMRFYLIWQNMTDLIESHLKWFPIVRHRKKVNEINGKKSTFQSDSEIMQKSLWIQWNE